MKHLALSVALAFGIFLFPHSETFACIDPGPDTNIRVIINYDTSQAPCIEEVEMRLTNLRLMNEDKGKICTCALDAWAPILTNVIFVAFVDSGTSDPYVGFAAWNEDAQASLEWQTAGSDPDWAGFIATVLNAGLSANDPVEMLFRMKAPIGVKYTLLGDSAIQARSLVDDIQNSGFGTDEWDPVNVMLGNTHQEFRDFRDIANAGGFSFRTQSDSYFAQLDSNVLNNIPNSVGIVYVNPELKISPNPFKDKLTIGISKSDSVSVVLRNHTGQIIRQQNVSAMEMDIDHLEGLDAGIYFLEVTGNKPQAVIKLLKL